MQMKVVDIDLMCIPLSRAVAYIYPHRHGRTDVCAYLLQVGANPSIADLRGKTPLDYASTAAMRKIFTEGSQQKDKK